MNTFNIYIYIYNEIKLIMNIYIYIFYNSLKMLTCRDYKYNVYYYKYSDVLCAYKDCYIIQNLNVYH